jgi:hypothetical protein
MSKYDHSDRLSFLLLTEKLEADQGVSEKFDPERPVDERFGKATLKVLEAEDPDSTYTRASCVSTALNRWIINSDLPILLRRRPSDRPHCAIQHTARADTAIQLNLASRMRTRIP